VTRTYAKTLKHSTNFSGRADHKIVARFRWNSQDKKDYFDIHDCKFELSRTSSSGWPYATAVPPNYRTETCRWTPTPNFG